MALKGNEHYKLHMKRDKIKMVKLIFGILHTPKAGVIRSTGDAHGECTPHVVPSNKATIVRIIYGT